MELNPRFWHVPNPRDLLLEHWDTETAVFDRRTGETHMLSALPAELLETLETGAMDAVALARVMAQTHDLPNDAVLKTQIQASLEQLARLDLIAPLSP